MNKKIILVILIVCFIVGLVIISNFVNKGSSPAENVVEKKAENVNEVEVMQVNSNNFQNEVINSEKTVLIDFYADWCPPCKKLSPLVKELANERKDIKFVKINVDNEAQIANEYGISSFPTLVVIKNGKEVNRSIGYIEKSKIEELIK